MLAINLVFLYAAAILILAAYPLIAGNVAQAAGGDGAIGPEYPVVFATRLLPGAACYLILLTLGVYQVARRRPAWLGAGLLLAWLSLAALTLGSIAWYFRPLGPAFP